MVSDALGDTFAGVVTWNPLRCSLALHLRSVIRSRLSHELERNEDHPHVDIETAAEHEVNEALSGVEPLGTTFLDEYLPDSSRQTVRVVPADSAQSRAVWQRDGSVLGTAHIL